MEPKNLIFRILGNDIFPIHSDTQTYNNLLFTIQNEPEFKNTDKIYLLNLIIDTNKRQNLINLLESYSIKYFEIPFNYDEFRNLSKISKETAEICENILTQNARVSSCHRDLLSRELSEYRLFIMNINYARNYCIEYGKKYNYRWTFVFDSNIFLTTKCYDLIINNILPDTEYITIPQIRLLDGNYSNEIILTNPERIETLSTHEHQLAFSLTSKYRFNEDIPYGTMNKGEFLNALQVPGPWTTWGSDLNNLGISQRIFKNVLYQTLSKCIRLNPGVETNSIGTNWLNRMIGTYVLYKQIVYLQ